MHNTVETPKEDIIFVDYSSKPKVVETQSLPFGDFQQEKVEKTEDPFGAFEEKKADDFGYFGEFEEAKNDSQKDDGFGDFDEFEETK